MTKKNYKEQFKNKKITVMGLGLLGGAVNDILFLAQQGAVLTVTDLKKASKLKVSIQKLKKYPNIKFVLGKHRLEDFRKADMILQPGNVPENSPYLIEAKKNKIPIFVSESLFAKYEPGVTMIGITGTRGKSMTTALIYEILSKNIRSKKGSPVGLCPRVYLAGNVRNTSTLALLQKVKKGDVVVMELDSWALHGMGDIKKSPQISVFTSFMPDHMNFYASVGSTQKAMKKYFEDKANIFKYQTKENLLIVRPDVQKLIPKNIKSRFLIVQAEDTKKYNFKMLGKFQQENLACAVAVAKEFKIPDYKIVKALKNFKGLEGRLQYLKTIKNKIKIYNDNNATTPEATMAGIEALALPFREREIPVSWEDNKIVLICGGADKGLALDDLVKIFDEYCKIVIMIPGSGTDKLAKHIIDPPSYLVADLKDALEIALLSCQKGDIILFSPAFASFGQFNNEYERNDLFMKLVKKLK